MARNIAAENKHQKELQALIQARQDDQRKKEKERKTAAIRQYLERRGNPYAPYAELMVALEERTGTSTKLVIAIGIVEQGNRPWHWNSWGLSNGTHPLCIRTKQYCKFRSPEDGLTAIYEFLDRRGWNAHNIDRWRIQYVGHNTNWNVKVKTLISTMDW